MKKCTLIGTMTARWEAKCYTLSNRCHTTYIISPYSSILEEAVLSQTHDSLTGRPSIDAEETSDSERHQEDETDISETLAENLNHFNNTPSDVAYRSTVTGITVWGRERLRRQMRKRKGKQSFRLYEVTTELVETGEQRDLE